MTERELREIKRRFRPERSNIPRIVGCFVNGGGQIVSKISQSLGLSDEAVNEKLLGVMKKALSGGLGTNLTEMSFSTKEVSEGEEHALLMRLRKSELKDDEALNIFYNKVIGSVKFEGNYVILLANDIYDVSSRHSDGEEGESYTQFSYIVCAICPLKDSPDTLTFREADSLFHSSAAASLLCPPEIGLMFPLFDDRAANIYGALYYTKSVAESYPDFTGNIFGKGAPMPPKAQKATFSGLLSDTLGDECDLNLVRSVHAQVAEMVEVHKESRDPEPLVITKSTAKSILENCGVGEERIEKFCKAFDEGFGKNATLTPKNIVSHSKFDAEMPEVKIKVSADHRDIVSTQVINGEKYIMIKVTGPLEINGINVNIDD
ncbi:MAG: DUF4317 domain-containing protein [Clostridia bacterium]|nr:DUF4317 domain-containing protein [Clostridia bacterium]